MDKICNRCGGYLKSFTHKVVCINCGNEVAKEEIFRSSSTSSSNSLTLPCDNLRSITKTDAEESDLISYKTITILDCKKIKLQHKEIDVEFELDAEKLKNIDTIIINGHKYTKVED